MNHACELELIDLLRMTSEYLSRFTNEFQEKQTCNVEMRHLYKRIYFNPGLATNTSSADSSKSSSSNAATAVIPGKNNMRRSHSTPPASPRRQRE